MQENTVEKYFNDRWQPQRNYYSSAARRNKRWHQSLLAVSVLGAILVPVLLNIPEIPKWIPTIISVLVSVALALDNTLNFGENWRSFRHTLEILKQERVYFEMGVEPYTDPQTASSLFVKRCEEAMRTEGEEYFKRHKPVEQASNSQKRNY